MTTFDQSKYINRYIKENYDRINFTVPAGDKEKIASRAREKNMSINHYLRSLVEQDLLLREKEKVSKSDGPIPDEFRPIFWDTDFSALDLHANAAYIIIRMFTKGGIRGIRWAKEHFSSDDITHAAKKRRDLNPIVANYLSKSYHIDRQEMRYYSMAAPMDWR